MLLSLHTDTCQLLHDFGPLRARLAAASDRNRAAAAAAVVSAPGRPASRYSLDDGEVYAPKRYCSFLIFVAVKSFFEQRVTQCHSQ